MMLLSHHTLQCVKHCPSNSHSNSLRMHRSSPRPMSGGLGVRLPSSSMVSSTHTKSPRRCPITSITLVPQAVSRSSFRNKTFSAHHRDRERRLGEIRGWRLAGNMLLCSRPSPFFLRRPQQVGPQDNGDVAGCHLVHFLLFSQQCQKLHQVPGLVGDRGSAMLTNALKGLRTSYP